MLEKERKQDADSISVDPNALHRGERRVTVISGRKRGLEGPLVTIGGLETGDCS